MMVVFLISDFAFSNSWSMLEDHFGVYKQNRKISKNAEAIFFFNIMNAEANYS